MYIEGWGTAREPFLSDYLKEDGIDMHCICPIKDELTYSELISKLWNMKERLLSGGVTLLNKIIIRENNDDEICTLIYNEEKKGYRPIEPIEWE